MSEIILEGYDVSFARLKKENEYKHPIIYDKFPITSQGGTVIRVSEPKIPFRFPDYGCLWNDKKENPYFNANPFGNLKDVERYYLPKNSVNNMIKSPMFTGTTKIFLNNSVESVHDQWKLFTKNTGLSEAKGIELNLVNTGVEADSSAETSGDETEKPKEFGVDLPLDDKDENVRVPDIPLREVLVPVKLGGEYKHANPNKELAKFKADDIYELNHNLEQILSSDETFHNTMLATKLVEIERTKPTDIAAADNRLLRYFVKRYNDQFAGKSDEDFMKIKTKSEEMFHTRLDELKLIIPQTSKEHFDKQEEEANILIDLQLINIREQKTKHAIDLGFSNLIMDHNTSPYKSSSHKLHKLFKMSLEELGDFQNKLAGKNIRIYMDKDGKIAYKNLATNKNATQDTIQTLIEEFLAADSEMSF